jgi:hypothetical protein
MSSPAATVCAPGAETGVAALAGVTRELRSISEALDDAAATARMLDQATDWHARAAQAFHERAFAWAGDVSGLACLLESVILEVGIAQQRAAVAAEACW